MRMFETNSEAGSRNYRNAFTLTIAVATAAAAAAAVALLAPKAFAQAQPPAPPPTGIVASGHAQVGTPQVTVYVTVPMEDGFADASKDLEDSVNDIKKQIRRAHELLLVGSPSEADLVLTVVARGTGSRAFGSRLTIQHYYTGTSLMSLPMVANTRWVSTVLQIGPYRKEFSAAETNASVYSMGSWGDDAGRIVKDLRSWVKVNEQTIRARRSDTPNVLRN